MIKSIALGFGFAEEQSNAWLMYHTLKPNGFKNKKTALYSLAKYFWVKYTSDQIETKLDCCERNKTSGYKYCPSCSKLLKAKDFEPEDFRIFLYDILNGTADSYGDHEIFENKDQWDCFINPFNVKDISEILIIPENADKVLTN